MNVNIVIKLGNCEKRYLFNICIKMFKVIGRILVGCLKL